MSPVSAWVRDRGLLIANLALFFIFLVGMILTGSRVYSDDQVSTAIRPPLLGST